MNYLVRDREVIFNLAGQVSHIDSMRDPYTDLEINCRSQLTILEACRQHNPARQGRLRRHAPGLRPARSPAGRRDAPGAPDRRQRHQQGRRRVLPPRLQQRVRRPRLLAAPDQRLRPAAARSSTTARASSAGSSAWRVEDEEIQIFGDGSQLRDFVYVDDAADAFLRAGATRRRATARCSTSAAPSRSATATWCTLLIEVAGHRRRAASSSGRPRRRRSTSAASTPTRRKFRQATGWEPTVDAARRAARARSRSTASTCRTTWLMALPHDAAACRSCRCGPGDDRRGHRRRHRARHRSRLVHPRPRGRGLRAGVRRGVRRRRTRSASAPAPTRSR